METNENFSYLKLSNSGQEDLLNTYYEEVFRHWKLFGAMINGIFLQDHLNKQNSF